MLQGKIYLIGAGPRDAQLITLKGYQLICSADVILYDHLAPSELLKLARPDAQVISVAKFASRHTVPQPEINKLLIEKAFKRHPGKIAAVIVEPVAGNMGVVLPNKDLLKTIKKLCTKNRSLLIFDEVNTNLQKVSYRGRAQNSRKKLACL